MKCIDLSIYAYRGGKIEFDFAFCFVFYSGVYESLRDF